MTQESLANAAGVSRESVYRTELGTHSVSLDMLIRMAHALGVATVHLFWDG